MGGCQSHSSPQPILSPAQGRPASAHTPVLTSPKAATSPKGGAASLASSPKAASSPKPVYLSSTVAQFVIAASPTAGGTASAAPWASPTAASVTLVQRQPSTTPAYASSNNTATNSNGTNTPVQRRWSQDQAVPPSSLVTSMHAREEEPKQSAGHLGGSGGASPAKRGSASSRIRLAETSDAQLRREVDALTIPLSSPQRAEQSRVAAAKEKADKEVDFIQVERPVIESDVSIADTCSGWLCASHNSRSASSNRNSRSGTASTLQQLPCSKLVCLRCEQHVVWLEGRRWNSPEEASYLFLRTHHPSLESLSGATESSIHADTRAYACQCAAVTIEAGQDPVAPGSQCGIDGAILKWKCGGGHATQDVKREQLKNIKEQQQLRSHLIAVAAGAASKSTAAQIAAPRPSDINFDEDDDDVVAIETVPTRSSISLPPLKVTSQQRRNSKQQEVSPFVIPETRNSA